MPITGVEENNKIPRVPRRTLVKNNNKYTYRSVTRLGIPR
jgi:hypothetical protein